MLEPGRQESRHKKKRGCLMGPAHRGGNRLRMDSNGGCGTMPEGRLTTYVFGMCRFMYGFPPGSCGSGGKTFSSHGQLEWFKPRSVACGKRVHPDPRKDTPVRRPQCRKTLIKYKLSFVFFGRLAGRFGYAGHDPSVNRICKIGESGWLLKEPFPS